MKYVNVFVFDGNFQLGMFIMACMVLVLIAER